MVQAQTSSPQSELTQRQHQILKLLQAGKVNKEIANELGIGLGTVKQHVVALFKRLNVRNRAMAASTGVSTVRGTEEGGATLAADGLLERRPCVVLSTALPDDAEPAMVRRLHGILASLAFDNDALFLARKGNAGDVIFGVQRVTEYDLIKALRTAHAAFTDLSSLDPGLAAKLCGGLSAGLAVASMKRYGGWSGEAIASAAIFSARELMQDADPGQLVIGQPAQDLMSAFGIGDERRIPGELPFRELETLRWTGERFAFPLIERRVELRRLVDTLEEVKSGCGRLIYLEGETGMGKSRMCREALESCLKMGGYALFFRCQPLDSGGLLSNALGRAVFPAGEVGELLRLPARRSPELVVVDDFHMLSKENRSMLSNAAVKADAKGRLVIFSGRRCTDIKTGQAEIIRLGRLPADAIEKLIRVVHGSAEKMRSSKVKALSKLAAGVPLFAVELAKHNDTDTIELPLMVIVCTRLDALLLDKKVLRVVARCQGNPTLDEVAMKLGEDTEVLRPAVERAMASGVLSLGEDGRLSFSHPLLGHAINHLSMD